MKNYKQNTKECCFCQDCGRTKDAHWHSVYQYYQYYHTVAAARREMTELYIRPNVQPFGYQIFSPLISLWC
ncbi:hypothetical protein E2C01_081946 [Portunus trituberculatus]|uniref:Uncharacterized protein n=1 Tax=Portunus trituberculatus TaxID=210409 RepID=A0A5B7IZH0_PORTR|nr:hypothetical protein [Portunus trituberculatus]